MVGTVVKAIIRELEEELRVGSSRRMRKELTGVVQGVSGRRGFLVRFQNGGEKNLSSNQLTVVTSHKILVEEAPEVSTIPEIPEDNAKKQKGYYQCVYVMIQFKKEVGVEINEEQADVYDDPDEEEVDDVNIDNNRERHWRMVFEDKEGGVDDKRHFYMLRGGIYM